MRTTIIAVFVALVALCAFATAQEIAEDWVNKGDELYENGHYEEATQAFDKALQIDPNNAEAWEMRGNTLVCLDQQDVAIKSYEMAIKIVDKMIEENSNDAELWWFKADSLDTLGRKEAAIQAYNKVIELNSSKAKGAWIRKSEIFLAQPKKYNESLQSFDKAVELMPNDAARIVESVWEENGSSIFITVWGDEDQLIKITLGRHNESTGDYDRTLEIFSKSISEWLINKEIEYKLSQSSNSIEG